MKLASPSESLSTGVCAPVLLPTEVSVSVAFVTPATSSKPSLSASTVPSKMPSLFVSTSLASAPLSTRSLMPSLSLSKSIRSTIPSPSVSLSAGATKIPIPSFTTALKETTVASSVLSVPKLSFELIKLLLGSAVTV